MNRTDLKNFFDFFSREVDVTHCTTSTGGAILTGPLDLFQIQVDTLATATLTTLEIRDGAAGPVYKRVTFVNAGTREVTFLGRPVRFNTSLYLTRPDGDNETVHLTILYRD